jgi:hypothetical protein
MTKEELRSLEKGASIVNKISKMLADQDDPDATSIQLAQLAGIAGCFTTLAKIAEHLHDTQAVSMLGRLDEKKEMMQ